MNGQNYKKISKYNNNYNEHAVKDSILSKLIPDKISECALYAQKRNGVCISDNLVNRIGKSLNIRGEPADVMKSAKSKLSCNTEKCVVEKVATNIDYIEAKREVNLYLKIAGPLSTDLLSNVNIDKTLFQWSQMYKDFYPYCFNMVNYASYSYRQGRVVNKPDSLATILFTDLYFGEFGKEYRCAACVINTDTYQGPGKHWMALFADARDNEWTVEFFNSSGNAPSPEWVNWMVKTKIGMEHIADRLKLNKKIEMLKVSNIRHQQSLTECGLYSLFYIWARLNRIPPQYFMENPIPDQLMFEFRHHLFHSEEIIENFDWKKYKSKNNIKWE
jgi:hypothetical protein